MRLFEIITLLGILVGAFFTVITSIEKKLIKRIKSIPTYSENKSKGLAKISSISKWRLSHLQKLKVIVKVNSGEYHLDEENYTSLKKKRVRDVVIFLLVSIILIVIIDKYGVLR